MLLCGEIALGVKPEDMRPVEAIAKISAPVFVLAGDRDRWTPIEETREFFARACAPKSLWEVRASVMKIYAILRPWNTGSA